MAQLSAALALCFVHTSILHAYLHVDLAAALDVTPEEFGAVGDGQHDDTSALRAAIATCAQAPSGPCHVLLTRHYSSGPLRFNTSGVTLNVTGILSMLPRDKYPSSPADQAEYGSFISNQPGIEGLTITGNGLITGLGRQWWPCKYTGCWRPHLIVLSSMTGVKIGPLHMSDGPNHFIEANSCTNVRVRGLIATAPNNSPNTDGMNFYGGHDQMIVDSVITNGDDCISVVPTGDPASAKCVLHPEQCAGGDLIVHNVTCKGGHGLSIGSVRHGDVRNVTFSSCVVTREAHSTQGIFSSGGLRIKSYPNGTGTISDIVYKDIEIHDVAYPLQLQARYCPGGQGSCPSGKTSIQLRAITFQNISGRGQHAEVGTFNCDPIAPCEDITLNSVSLTSTNILGLPAKFECENVRGTASPTTKPKSCFNE